MQPQEPSAAPSADTPDRPEDPPQAPPPIDPERAELEALVEQLEKVVDRAIMRAKPGRTFRTLIGKDDRLTEAARLLIGRYKAHGWSGGRVDPYGIGGTWLILEP